MSDDGAAAAVRVRDALDLPYALGIVAGSGLGALADALSGSVRIPYAELPGFPVPTVSGHRPALAAGRLENAPVVVLGGRAHFYERGRADAMRVPIGMLKRLGCGAVLLTNAAGSLRAELGPGELMLVEDHIAFAGANPLIGEASDARFVGMTAAYDTALREALARAAAAEGIGLARGVYMWFSGPSFETPAEIRMARTLGADAVGMSTVPEVILARFFGLRVAAVSTITNLAAGMTGAELSHEETKATAPKGAAKLIGVIRRFLKDGGLGAI